jgi:Dyp-type peroxidase family
MSINLDVPIDRDLPGWRSVFALLQGNILKSHGRDHSALVLLQFEQHADLRTRLRQFAANRVTSAQEQFEQIARYRKQKNAPQKTVDQQLFSNIFLSVWGYRALRYGEAELRWAFPHPQDDKAHLNWFLQGMEHQGGLLCDPPRAFWDAAYRDRIDAIVLLAADDLQRVNSAVDEALQDLDGFARVIQIERGKTLRRDGYPIEHFGFMDGVSQPHFFQGETDLERPAIVLAPDNLGGGPDSFGSYVVYRKLEQNVKAFHAAEKELIEVLGLAENDYDRAGAMIVGRFRDGSPLTKSGKAGFPGDDDFNFNEDSGSKCPMHSHIRKMRSRWDGRDRIVRRGVPYGPYNPCDPSLEPPEQGSGLLFLSFQRNLQIQFGDLYTGWANRTDVPAIGTGQDSLLGQGWSRVPQQWPVSWGKTECKPFHCGSASEFVKLKGGEFFFAPSLAFFRQL